MPDGDPRVGECYMASPETSVNGDAHGQNQRPVAVVERLPRVAVCLGRTTHPRCDDRKVYSPKNPGLGLSKDGYWTDRNQRMIPSKFWGTDKFRYRGKLPQTEVDELAEFWAKTVMLGRRGL